MSRKDEPLTTRLLLLLLCLACAAPVAAQTYDLALMNGRVMDPESGLDAIRAFGIPFAEPVLVPPAVPATDLPATPEQEREIEKRLNSELDAGALGVGMG